MGRSIEREVNRTATGPSRDEFECEGATFLVGIITPAYPSRLANYIQLSPEDPKYTRYAYLDTLPVLTGGLSGVSVGAAKLRTDTQAKLEAKHAKIAERRMSKATRSENRTGRAARELSAWAARNGVTIRKFWDAGEDGNKGSGFIYQGGDSFTQERVLAKATAIAKIPLTKSYVISKVLPGGDQLIAFVVDPKLQVATPDVLSTALSAANQSNALVELAESNDPGLANWRDDVEPQDIRFGHATVTASPVSEINVFPSEGVDVGKLFGNLFGPKKPEAIQKKIDKLESQLADLKQRLKDAQSAESSGGMMVIGTIPMFDRASRRSSGRYDESDHIPELWAEEMAEEPEEVGVMLAAPGGRALAGRPMMGPGGPRPFAGGGRRPFGGRPGLRRAIRRRRPFGPRPLGPRPLGIGRRAVLRRPGFAPVPMPVAAPQPTFVPVPYGVPPEGYGDEGYGDEGYGYGDEGYDYGAEGLVVLGTLGAGQGLPGRVYDLPRSPNGYVTNYPSGG